MTRAAGSNQHLIMDPIRKQNRPGFTLVELLTVVAIMGLLMAMSLPAYIKVSKGAALRSAVAQVRSTLSLARQYAIANNEVVYSTLR